MRSRFMTSMPWYTLIFPMDASTPLRKVRLEIPDTSEERRYFLTWVFMLQASQKAWSGLILSNRAKSYHHHWFWFFLSATRHFTFYLRTSYQISVINPTLRTPRQVSCAKDLLWIDNFRFVVIQKNPQNDEVLAWTEGPIFFIGVKRVDDAKSPFGICYFGILMAIGFPPTCFVLVIHSNSIYICLPIWSCSTSSTCTFSAYISQGSDWLVWLPLRDSTERFNRENRLKRFKST